MPWDQNADALKKDVEKYSNASYAAFKADDYDEGEAQWVEAQLAHKKLAKYLRESDV